MKFLVNKVHKDSIFGSEISNSEIIFNYEFMASAGYHGWSQGEFRRSDNGIAYCGVFTIAEINDEGYTT